MHMKVAINGFGRIGRLVFRIIREKFKQIDVVAINDLVPADNLAYLLKHDSIHRTPAFSIEADGDHLVVDGKRTQVLSMKDPTSLPWKKLNAHFVIESTGLFTHLEDAHKHID